MIEVQRIWRELCATLALDRHRVADTWSALAAAYAEPWRHYHTMEHIGALLALRAEHADLFRDMQTVDFAIFLHDVVYEPRRSDNEARSAEWARTRLPDLGLDSARIEPIAYFIEMSRHDAASLAAIDPASDLALFLDLDLSILAADGPAYAAYSRAVRREYAIYPDHIFRPGRARVLQSFLNRPTIYCAAPLRAAWEDRARSNLEAELRALNAPA